MSVPTSPFGASPSSRRFIRAKRHGSTQTSLLFSSEAAISASSSSAIGGSHVATPTFGRTEFRNSSSGGQPRGSGAAPFTPTEEENGQWLPGKLQSICGMTVPVYKCKSHEELRWEDYQLGDKGGPNHAAQSGVSVGPGASPAIPWPAFSQSSPFSSTTASNAVSSAAASATTSNPSASTPFGSSPFGFTLAQTSTSGITSHPSPPAFGSSIFRSSVPWGAQSQSVFGASSNPGSASTTPAFGTASPSFGATSTPAFAAFGSRGSPISGSGSAFGSSSNAIFGASWSSSTSFGSSPAFGPSETAFRSNQFESGSYGARRGSRVAPFTPTEEEETGQMGPCKLQSICGMPAYKYKIHEELRWEDYQLGDKGGPNHAAQSGVGVGPGASPAIPWPAFSQSSPFSSTTASNTVSSAAASATTSNPSASTPFGSSPFGFTLAQTSTSGITSHPSPPAFGSSIFRSSVPWGAQSQSVFGASSNPGSALTTPAFGTASPSFGATSTPAFAAFGSRGSPISGSGSAFGYSSNAIFGASWSSSLSFGSSPAFGPSETAFRSNQFESGSYGARRGSRVAPVTPTEEEETGQMGPCKLQSICGMPAFKYKIHEELRWEDYQLGDKGGPNHAAQSGVSVGPGASPAIPWPAFSQSSPFSSTTASNAVSSAAASATTSNPSASTPFGSSPFGFALAQTSTSGTTSHPTPPAFGSSIFRSSVPWGGQSQSVFGASSNPGSASTTPALGTASPSFGPTSTPAFAAFGSTGSPLSGSGSAFGSSSNAIFGASWSSSSSFGSSPTKTSNFTKKKLRPRNPGASPSSAFGASPSSRRFIRTKWHGSTQTSLLFSSEAAISVSSSSAFGSQVATPTFGRTEFRNSSSGGQPRGSRVAPFTPTEEENGQWLPGKLQSICGMTVPVYKCKSHEELRWEDYQLGDKGGPNHVGQSAVSVGPGASPAFPRPTFSWPSPSISTTATNAFSSAPASSGSGRSLFPSRPSPVLSTNAGAIGQTNECGVCLNNPKNMAFGCGHMACRECQRKLSHCPMCRQPITIRLRLYM